VDAWIVQGVRTPFCKLGTALERFSALELGRTVLRECLYRAELDPAALDAVVLGSVAPPADAVNLARVVALQAGVPESVPALTVCRNCASGMEAVVQAARLVETGEAHVVAALGVESMTHIPLLLPDGMRRCLFRWRTARSWWGRLRAAACLRPSHFSPIVGLLIGLTDPVCGLNMGETAEVLAREFGIDREVQDRYARRSQERTEAARLRGVFAAESVPLYAADGRVVVSRDVGPRPDTSLEQLGRLKPVFDRRFGTVTAGNSSLVSDGGVAVLVMSDQRCRALRMQPMARLKARAVVGCSPRRMGLGPAYAIPAVLAAGGVELQDVDLVEINEAFAVQVLACLEAMDSPAFAGEVLGLARPPGRPADDRLNVNGGALALGHPVGASGARLVLTLAMEMQRRDAGLGLASLCVGGGQGQAVLLERS
jgi:acetyl-CoA C-acetyltransferase/acetyl-CoA acyltransferase